MKLLPIALLVILAQVQSQSLLGNLSSAFGILNLAKNPCERDATPKFKDALNDFSVRLMKKASMYSSGSFVLSPYSIWLSLASIAEFASLDVQPELFSNLNLPEEKCVREKFYQLATNLEVPGPDVRFERSRAIAIDELANINEEWTKFSSSILSYIQVPFTPETFENVQDTMGVLSKISLEGHSILFDRLDYEGLWTSAFADGTIEMAPFYNDLGQQVATLPFMRMKSRVRLAHLPVIDAKVLELPVGMDGRYTMLLTMGVKNNTIKRMMDLLMSSVIVDIMSSLTLSLIPVEVAIPRFSMTSGFDARTILEELGFGMVFSDPAATRYISEPPALPSSYLQRVSINMTSLTLANSRRDNPNLFSGFLHVASQTATGMASAMGRDFVANRPFMFTLIDTKTRVPVFTGIYSYTGNRYLI